MYTSSEVSVYMKCMQAAKEFETELKKEPDSPADPPVENLKEAGQEEKPDAVVSSTKESW